MIIVRHSFLLHASSWLAIIAIHERNDILYAQDHVAAVLGESEERLPRNKEVTSDERHGEKRCGKLAR